MAVPSKRMIREYGLKEATLMAQVDEAFGIEHDDRPLAVEIEAIVPAPDGSDERVRVRGTSIQDALDNAMVAYGDAELCFPINPDLFFSNEYLDR